MIGGFWTNFLFVMNVCQLSYLTKTKVVESNKGGVEEKFDVAARNLNKHTKVIESNLHSGTKKSLLSH